MKSASHTEVLPPQSVPIPPVAALDVTQRAWRRLAGTVESAAVK
jgi:hypothetical protein